MDDTLRKPEFKTPLKRVRHYGAAGHGVEHFIAQKASALGLLIFLPLFLVNFTLNAKDGAAALTAWLASPAGALISLVFFALACFHMRIGMATVIEDYVERPAFRYLALLANTAIAFTVWGAASFSILLLALGS